jgi:hypothetical protein
MGQRCVVLNCTNFRHQGDFVGPLCAPCWGFVVEGRGVHSQAFRNAVEATSYAALNGVKSDQVPLVRKEHGLYIGDEDGEVGHGG